MLDLLGSVLGMAAILVDAVAILFIVPFTGRQRLIAGGVIGAWVGLATALGATGALAFSPQHPVPLVGVLFAIPLVSVGLSLLSPTVRGALMAIPMQVLIGLNAMRVLGWLFLALAAVGRLSGPFPFSAGLGDIITGLLAIPLALRIARAEPAPVGAWNAFGALDLIFALGFGLTSSPGSPLQVFHVGVGSDAMQHLPFSLVPTALVPFYLITHGVIAAQLAARRKVRAFAAA